MAWTRSSKSGINTEVHSSNNLTSVKIPQVESAISAFNDFIGQETLEGSGYQNAKNFYMQTYVPLLKELEDCLESFKTAANDLQDNFSNNVTNPLGHEAKRSDLLAKIEEYKALIKEAQRMADDFKNWKNGPIGGVVKMILKATKSP